MEQQENCLDLAGGSARTGYFQKSSSGPSAP
jgi:hypothetical protein